MSAITYTAKRNISDGRSALTEYSFEVPLLNFDREPLRKKSVSASLSGIRHTVLHRIDNFYKIKTAPIKNTTLLNQMREFIDSVAAGETFTIDAFGTIAAPNNPLSFEIDGDYSESLVEISGFYSFSFRVINL